MLITQGSLVRNQPDPPSAAGLDKYDNATAGGLAKLGEHLLCKQGVVGSIPSSSTNPAEIKGKQADACLPLASGQSAVRSLTKRKKVVYRRDELLIHVVIASVLVL